MGEHTPGPWKVEETTSNHYYTRGRKGLQVRVSEYRAIDIPGPKSEESTRANAALIAAAPELLAALKDVAEQIAAYDHLHGENSCAIDDAPALAAIRGLNPCYDPTSSIYPEVK